MFTYCWHESETLTGEDRGNYFNTALYKDEMDELIDGRKKKGLTVRIKCKTPTIESEFLSMRRWQGNA